MIGNISTITITMIQVQDMINEVDADGSGAVEFPEFCVMMVKKMQESDTENEVPVHDCDDRDDHLNFDHHHHHHLVNDHHEPIMMMIDDHHLNFDHHHLHHYQHDDHYD